MVDKSKRSNGQDGALSSLNAAIDALNLSKETMSITPAKAAFGSASVLLTTIRVGFLLVHTLSVDFWLTYTGFIDQRGGLRPTRANLRRSLWSPWPGDEK